MSYNTYKQEWLIIALSKELQIREDILKNALNKWAKEYSTNNPEFIKEIEHATFQGPTENTSSGDSESSRVSNEIKDIAGQNAIRESRRERSDRPKKLRSKIKD
jgi:gas vesicle protein